MRKDFPTLAVLSVSTGYLLADNFSAVHGVMDHLYPGIMTIGVAAMQANAAAEVRRQVASAAEIPGGPTKDTDWPLDAQDKYSAAALSVLGPTVGLEGPINVAAGEVEAAFVAFGARTP